MKYTLCAIGFTLCLASITARPLHRGIEYRIESSAAWSGKEGVSPFWLTSNRHGLLSTETSNGYLRTGLFRKTSQDSARNWRHGYGLDLAVHYNHQSTFFVQQAYYDIAWRWIQLSMGSKERPSELKNPILSSGGLTFGTNARPIPQVRIEVPEYVTLPFWNEWVHLKGHFGYGIYTDNNWQADFAAPDKRYTQNTLLHSKAGFIKIGNEKKFPLYFEGGAEMGTQFGGKAYNVWYGDRANGGMEVKQNDFEDLGHGFKDFIKAIFPFKYGGDPTDGEGYTNVTGNHLGSWHAAFTWQAKTWKIRAYYEHYFEDHSMIIDEYAWKDYVDNFGNDGIGSYIPPIIPTSYYWKDGLYGLEVEFPKNPFVTTFLYEFMSTKEQSGPIYHDHTGPISDQISGIDNYYNHTIYTGWQHWGMGLGTPFVTSPIYNTDGVIDFKSNRVHTHHFGLCGNPTKELAYRLLLSHSKHWGTYNRPLIDTQEQTSGMLEISYAPHCWKGWNFKGTVAWDRGKMLGDQCGGMLTISKSGILTK